VANNRKGKLNLQLMIFSIVIQFFLTIILTYIRIVLINAIISAFVVGVLIYLNYKINSTPLYIREFKKLIHSNNDYSKINNMDNIVEFFKKGEVNSFFKIIFPIIEAENNPKSRIHLKLENKRFYGFFIYDNKLSLIDLKSNEFLSAKHYYDRRNTIVDKKRLKIFFKDLIEWSRNPGTDYMDYIAEKKKDDIYKDIANMTENTSY